MKLFTTHIIALAVAIFAASGMAGTAQNLTGEYDDSNEYFDSKKHNKWHTSPNFKKALDILKNVDEDDDIDYDEAVDLLESEIKQHPANGYALCNLAVARTNKNYNEFTKILFELIYGNNDYSEEELEKIIHKRGEQIEADTKEAIDMLYKGIALIPAADKPNLCKAYIYCGNIQKNDLNNTEQAIADYEKAAQIFPCYQSYDNLMKFYMVNGDNAKVLEYASILGSKIDGDNETLRYFAQYYIDNNDYDTALTYINKAIANDDTDMEARQMLVDMLIKQGKHQEALDNVVKMSNDLSASALIHNLFDIYKTNDSSKAMVINKLHQLEATTSDEDEEQETTEWNYFEGTTYYLDHDYRNALTCFEKTLYRKPDPALISLMADCHYMLGNVPKALELLNYTLRMPVLADENENQERILSNKINIEMKSGMLDEQIYDSQVYIKAFSQQSDFGFATLARGYFNKGLYAKAVETCDAWAEVSENAIFAKYYRAFSLMLWGKTKEAQEEYREILNDDACDNEMKLFALIYLGETQKAKTMLDEMAQVSEQEADATEPSDEVETMSFYNLACAYSLLGEGDRALYFLDRHYAEEENATDFDYAILDDELNNARRMPQFMQIINKYKTQWLNGEYGRKK